MKRGMSDDGLHVSSQNWVIKAMRGDGCLNEFKHQTVQMGEILMVCNGSED